MRRAQKDSSPFVDTGGGATHNEQDYGYDAVGNMWATTNLGSKLPASPDTPASAGAYRSGNHLNGVNYDAAGSQTTDPAMCPTTSCIQYDAENRQVVFGTNYYQYDGEGRRVVSATTSGTTIYVYDAEGKGAAEYASSLPTPVCSTCFLTTDHLGSTRLVTDQNANVIARHDYMPFGQELINGYAGRSAQYGASDLVSQKFTGKERDSESGLDYFGARYYGSALGRWTSPDWNSIPQPIPFADVKDPQTLNLYAYVRNNPLGRADLDGHADCGGETNKSWLYCLGNALGLNQTETQKAEVARAYFELNPHYDANGNVIDPTKMSNAEVVKVFQDFNHQRQDAMTQEAIATAGDRAMVAAAGASVSLLDAQAEQHTLSGDATGGGHRPGTGIPGKSEFPAGWSDTKILHEISDVATDPNAARQTQGRVTVITGTREGVNIRVVERDGRIVTGYPTNLPRNP